MLIHHVDTVARTLQFYMTETATSTQQVQTFLRDVALTWRVSVAFSHVYSPGVTSKTIIPDILQEFPIIPSHMSVCISFLFL